MNNDEIEQAIAHIGLGLFGEDTMREVENLLANGQTVEPEARQKLIRAAQRALRLHAAQEAAFEVLAFETRRQNNIDIDQLATALETKASLIRQVESGKAPLRDLGAPRVAAWIDKLNIDTGIALKSVEESLQPRRRQSAYAIAEDDQLLDPSAQAFLDAVRDALTSLREPH